MPCHFDRQLSKLAYPSRRASLRAHSYLKQMAACEQHRAQLRSQQPNSYIMLHLLLGLAKLGLQAAAELPCGCFNFRKPCSDDVPSALQAALITDNCKL